MCSLYKYDTHVHTAETSLCARVGGAEAARLYKAAGYDGIVITDHYYKEYFDNIPGKNWGEKIDVYLKGYRNAYNEGIKIGINVILGMELRFTEIWSDYLIYGIDEDFLKNNKDLYNLGLRKFKELVSDKNILIFQAHPFRIGITPASPCFLDGIEAYNMNPRHEARNHMAYSYARDNNLKMSSGSDFHEHEDLGRGGIILTKRVDTSKELVDAINNNLINGLIK